jgi:hypothetical protein
MDYYKYIKYKTKYLNLKYDNNQYGGGIVPCDKGYTNVLGTCWMSALLGILCFGDLTSTMVYDKMKLFDNPSVKEIKKNAEQFIETKIKEIQISTDNKIPKAFNNFHIFSDDKQPFVKIILHKFIERYYNKVMKKPFGKKPLNTDPYTNPDRCERIIGENFNALFKSFHKINNTLAAALDRRYLFCNLLSIFFLDYKVSFRNYYNNFSSIKFDDKNDLGILIHLEGHMCCLYMCDGRPKFYNDNNKKVYECEWKDLLKKSNPTNLLYVKEDGCLIIIADITAYVGDSKIYKVASLTVISKYETKYTDLDNDITTFLEFSNIKIIKDPSILDLIGHFFEETKKFDKARETYKLAADQGYLLSQYNLGSMLYYGEGGKTDYKTARYMFTLAANQGDRDAQYMLGHMLYYGIGGGKDEVEAIHMLKLAANQDQINAQNMLNIKEEAKKAEQERLRVEAEQERLRIEAEAKKAEQERLRIKAKKAEQERLRIEAKKAEPELLYNDNSGKKKFVCVSDLKGPYLTKQFKNAKISK